VGGVWGDERQCVELDEVGVLVGVVGDDVCDGLVRKRAVHDETAWRLRGGRGGHEVTDGAIEKGGACGEGRVEEEKAVVLSELGGATGDVVVDEDVVGDNLRAVFEDKDTPSDCVGGHTQEDPEACVAGEVRSLGAWNLDPSGAPECGAEVSDVETLSEKGGEGNVDLEGGA
jgi:hypothetical protein